MKKNQNHNHGSVKFSRLCLTTKQNASKTRDSFKSSEKISNYFVKKPEQDCHNLQETSNEQIDSTVSLETESPYKNLLSEVEPVINNSINDERDFKTPKLIKHMTKTIENRVVCNKDVLKVSGKICANRKLLKNRSSVRYNMQNSAIRTIEDNFHNDGVNAEHLQMAIALSKSIQDVESPEDSDIEELISAYPSTQVKSANIKMTLEQFGFKSSNSALPGGNKSTLGVYYLKVERIQKKYLHDPPPKSNCKLKKEKSLIEKSYAQFKHQNPLLTIQSGLDALFSSQQKVWITSAELKVFKKRKKSQYQYITPILFLRTQEDREKLISSKISLILAQKGEPYPDSHQEDITLHSPYLQKFYAADCNIFKITQMEISLNDIEQFYVKNLDILPSTLACGSLLRKWEDIPGRELTPPREVSLHIAVDSGSKEDTKSLICETLDLSEQTAVSKDGVNDFKPAESHLDILCAPKEASKSNDFSIRLMRSASPDLFDTDDEDSEVNNLNKSIDEKLQSSFDIIKNLKHIGLSQNRPQTSGSNGISEPKEIDSLSHVIAHALNEKDRSNKYVDTSTSLLKKIQSPSQDQNAVDKLEKTSDFVNYNVYRNERGISHFQSFYEDVDKTLDYYDLTRSSSEENITNDTSNLEVICESDCNNFTKSESNIRSNEKEGNKMIIEEYIRNFVMDIESKTTLDNGGSNCTNNTRTTEGQILLNGETSNVETLEAIDLTQSSDDSNMDNCDLYFKSNKMQELSIDTDVISSRYEHCSNLEIEVLKDCNKLKDTESYLTFAQNNEEITTLNIDSAEDFSLAKIRNFKQPGPKENENLSNILSVINVNNSSQEFMSSKCRGSDTRVLQNYNYHIVDDSDEAVEQLKSSVSSERVTFDKTPNISDIYYSVDNAENKNPSNSTIFDASTSQSCSDCKSEDGIDVNGHESNSKLKFNKSLSVNSSSVDDMGDKTSSKSTVSNTSVSQSCSGSETDDRIGEDNSELKFKNSISCNLTSDENCSQESVYISDEELNYSCIYSMPRSRERNYTSSVIKGKMPYSISDNEDSDIGVAEEAFKNTPHKQNFKYQLEENVNQNGDDTDLEMYVDKLISENNSSENKINQTSTLEVQTNNYMELSDSVNCNSNRNFRENSMNQYFDNYMDCDFIYDINTANENSVNGTNNSKSANLTYAECSLKHSKVQILNSKNSLHNVNDILEDTFNEILENTEVLLNIENPIHSKTRVSPHPSSCNNSYIKTDQTRMKKNIEKLKTPISKNIKSSPTTPDGALIIKTSNITPMPGYEQMDTPKLVKELEKFGIKNLKRRRGTQVLKYIYESTHPLIAKGEIEENTSDDDKRVVKRKKGKSKKSLEAECYGSNSGQYEDLDHVNECQLEERTSPSSSSACVEIVGDLLLEKESVESLIFERKYSTKIASCRVPLHIAWHNLVASLPELKENILLYEPLQLEVLYSLLKEQGYKYNIQDLLTFLDKKCITVRTNQNGNRTKKEKKT